MTNQPPIHPDPDSTWAKPIDHLKVGEAPGAALHMNVEGRHLTSPLNGFGALWQKTYRSRLEGSSASPQDVVRLWKEKLPLLMPDDSRFYPSVSGVKPGEVVIINATLPGIPGGMQVSTGVMILYVDDVSFSVMTPEGHPEAGFNTFSAYDDDGVTVIQIQSLARANDPIFEFGFRFLGGSKQQENIWRQVLTNLSAEFDVSESSITVEKVCVDNRLQWAHAANVRHNAIISTTLTAPGRYLQKILKRGE